MSSTERFRRELLVRATSRLDEPDVAQLASLAQCVDVSDLVAHVAWLRGHQASWLPSDRALGARVHSTLLRHDGRYRSASLLLVAHRSGFVREAALHCLPEEPRGALAAAWLADDHVDRIRDLARQRLQALPLAHVAYTAPLLFEPTRQRRDAGWRRQVSDRLATPEGGAARRYVAMTTRGALAWAAMPPTGANSSSWRWARDPSVRARVARTAPIDGALLFAADRHPQVRLAALDALLDAGCTRPDLAPLLWDRSTRVRRRAAYGLRKADSVWSSAMASQGLTVVQRARRLESTAVARRPEAFDHALDGLDSPHPALRTAAVFALLELDELSTSDLVQLALDPVPGVSRLAVAALGRGRLTLALLRQLRLAHRPDGVSLLRRAPFWESVDLAMQAVAEQWPGYERLEHALTNRASRLMTSTWTRPSPERLDEVREALDALEPRLPDDLVRAVRSVL